MTYKVKVAASKNSVPTLSKLTSPPICEAAVIVESVPALKVKASCSATTSEDACLPMHRLEELLRRKDLTNILCVC
jgi:hypothetical protein